MNTTIKTVLAVAILLLNAHLLFAQGITQTVRGTVADKVSQSPLPGVNIVVVGISPLVGTTTDIDGNFKLPNVPVGIYDLKVSYMGYKELIVPAITVNSGKEAVLNIAIEEDFKKLNEVVVKATEKNETINEMSVVSTRSFSVEETRRFAAAVNDPARMATVYAGVVGTDDGNNHISIRGNNPYGLLWRMEGVDIPNPNHFANVASAGGGVSILSAQLLTNSDFSTGAFAPEYGNALSGVFDLKLRKGNNERWENTIQASVLGLDFATEGPFSKKYKGSYLVNYRYSTLTILEKTGLLDFGNAHTNFQDLSFNIHLPSKSLGNFSLFGFGGLSSQYFDAEKDSGKWTVDDDRDTWNFLSNTGAAGLKHGYIVNEKILLQSALVFSGTKNGYEEERLNDNYEPEFQWEDNTENKKITASTTLSYKLNARVHSKSGVYFNQLFFDVHQRGYEEDLDQVVEHFSSSGKTQTVQAFSQWSYKLTEQLTLNGGLHTMFLTLNSSYAVEPRFSAQYKINQKNTLAFGYGLHSQLQPLGNYFTIVETEAGNITPNKELGFTKSNHFVLSYSRQLTDNLYAKAEAYYQHLFNIPISPGTNSTNALINREWGFETEALVNDGIGRNMGLEFTLEQYFSKGLYYLLSASLYDSKYRAADNEWYNTHYNGQFALSFAAGKEFTPNKKNKNRVYGINIKGNYNGGFRTTPIDLEASKAEGEAVYIQKEAYTIKLPNYFRTDIRVSMKRILPRITHTVAIDFQNVINRLNVFNQFYDAEKEEVVTYYQTGLIPVLSYKIDF